MAIGSLFSWTPGLGVFFLTLSTTSRSGGDDGAGVSVLSGSVFGLAAGRAYAATTVGRRPPPPLPAPDPSGPVSARPWWKAEGQERGRRRRPPDTRLPGYWGRRTEVTAVTHVDGADRSVGTLVKQGTEQLSQLVRQELRLAQAELTQKGKRAGVGGGLFGAAALFAFFGLAALIVTVIAAIPLSVWLASLIVAGGLLALAGVLALLGKHEVKQAVPPVPGEAVGSMRQDVETIRERARR
ncbi:phage holin family protein [Actinacidiphila sp. ITFR-21]|uniref:phage holin family protein n=1 Tax=Actinacidiphila sp. ITFR-21 TaxID=3075199 RepID=UPI00288AF7EC|nr:phage holin family protein [Streptomyces sp. ITFR-21]WNI16767.1 phage holin family protein [Streptomyces sp. ITFR-21]